MIVPSKMPFQCARVTNVGVDDKANFSPGSHGMISALSPQEILLKGLLRGLEVDLLAVKLPRFEPGFRNRVGNFSLGLKAEEPHFISSKSQPKLGQA